MMLYSVYSRGSAGVVHLAIDNMTGEEVAVKLIERGTCHSSGVLRSELINHSALGHHPHVIALKVFLCSTMSSTGRSRKQLGRP